MSVRARGSWHAVSMAALLIVVAIAPAGDRLPVPDGSTSSPAEAAAAAAAAANYGELPFQFEPNVGQAAPRVEFLARTGSFSLFLGAAEATIAPRSAAAGTAIRLGFRGADATARGVGEDRLPGTVNYFVGSDPAAWRSGIATYARVRYAAIYPGVDLVYYGNGGRLEYDFEVAAGADPGAIALAFDGATDLRLDDRGDLLLDGPAGQLRQHRPVAYQLAGAGRRSVEASYVVGAGGLITLALGRYDTSRPLVIDPVLEYSSFLGGTAGDGGNDAVNLGTDIAIDAVGAAYITGETISTDFPTTAGAYDTTDPGGTDVFITKLNPAGSALVYSTYLGGSAGGADVGYAIAVDGAGSAYVTGSTGGNFPITGGALDSVAGNAEPFVTKLNATGTALVYSTYLGGASIDRGYDIAVDASGNAVVAGQTFSTDFDTTAGAYDEVYNGGSGDAFVAKVNAAGTALVWSTFLGGSEAENSFGVSLALDADGNAYVAGETTSTDFPATPGAYDTVHNGGVYDVYVASLEADGSDLRYATYLGGSSREDQPSIAVDGTSAVVAGMTRSTNFPTTAGAHDTTDNPGDDAFVAKLGIAGDALLWSTYLGGSNLDDANAVGVDEDGNVYVAGYTVGSFPVTAGAHDTTGSFDGFFVRLSHAGNALQYATYFGGAGTDKIRAIAVSPIGDAYLAGTTRSTDLPTTAGAYDRSHNGGTVDLFVTKFNHVPFTDIFGTTFAKDIVWLYDAGITSGCAPTLYCPNSPVTRAQMASFLSRALGLPPTTTDYFSDDNGTTHEQNINRLAAAGITAGCAPGKFCPNDNVTRAQMASFLVRALGLTAGATINYFSDDNGNTHEQNINRLRHAGLTSGCTPTTYCPNADVTRGQMAAFLHRAFD